MDPIFITEIVIVGLIIVAQVWIFLRNLQAIGQLGEEERRAWRHLFEQLVFERDERDWEHLDTDRRGVMGAVSEQEASTLRRQIAQQLRL